MIDSPKEIERKMITDERILDEIRGIILRTWGPIKEPILSRCVKRVVHSMFEQGVTADVAATIIHDEISKPIDAEGLAINYRVIYECRTSATNKSSKRAFASVLKRMRVNWKQCCQRGPDLHEMAFGEPEK